MSIQALRQEWRAWLKQPQELVTQAGFETQWQELDAYLASNGFPRGEMTLIQGLPGTGRLTLWLQAASQLTQRGRWVAWLQNEYTLTAACLEKFKVRSDRMLCIQMPKDTKKIIWLLQECAASQIFDLIGFDIAETLLPDRQLKKLQMQVRASQLGLVCLSSNPKQLSASSWSSILQTEANSVQLLKCAHRPTPKVFKRRISYDSFIGFHSYKPATHALSSLKAEFWLERSSSAEVPQPEPATG